MYQGVVENTKRRCFHHASAIDPRNWVRGKVSARVPINHDEREFLNVPDAVDDIPDLNSPMEAFFRICAATERLMDPIHAAALCA